MKFPDRITKEAEHRLRCPAFDLQYPEIAQCFNPRGVSNLIPRLKSFPTRHRLDQSFAFPGELSVPRVKRQAPSLSEPHIRSIVERKFPCVRQSRNLRCIEIDHALRDQIFRCGQKSIHQIFGHSASSYLLQQHVSEFITPEYWRDPLGIHLQKSLNRTLGLRISDEKICHHRAIDNNHGGNLPSHLTRGKIFISNSAVKDQITSVPHQWPPEFLRRSTFFVTLSSTSLPRRSSERLDFFFLRHDGRRSHSAPRSLPGSRFVGSASPALSTPHAAHQAHFVSSMSACLQSASIIPSLQTHFS